MSLETIATWRSNDLAPNSTDTDNFVFGSGANDSFVFAHPSLPGGSSHGSAAGDPTVLLSAPNAAAIDTGPTEPSFLSELHNARIRADVADALGAHDSLSYHGMLQVLDAAAVGGMTASKFGALETLVSLMNAPDGISTSAYVQDISHSLIDGDPANAYWTGGGSKHSALGNLSATSTQTHVDELIGKWFLGTDLPSINYKGSPDATYEVHKGPLFAADGVPSYHDVNQGYVGDCYFLSTLAEVALQDPSAIESMIKNNGNGTYGVRFFIDGHADYVTVNNELPVLNDGSPWANGSTLKFANGANGQPVWAELVEKAFAQLNADQTPFTVKHSTRRSMPMRAPTMATRRMPSQKSPARVVSHTIPTSCLLTRRKLARRLTQARKWSSASVLCLRDIKAIFMASMFLKSLVTMQAMRSSHCIILGVRRRGKR